MCVVQAPGEGGAADGTRQELSELGAATGSGAVLPTWITAIFAVDLGAAAFLAWPLSPDELRLPSDGGERLGPRARAAAFLLLAPRCTRRWRAAHRFAAAACSPASAGWRSSTSC